MTAAKKGPVEIVFSGPPGPDSGRFVEVEQEGYGIALGEWRERSDGLWSLDLPPEVRAAPEMAEALAALLKQFGPAGAWDDDNKRLACENASAALRKAGRTS